MPKRLPATDMKQAIAGVENTILIRERELLEETRLSYIIAHKKSLLKLREEREKLCKKLRKLQGLE